MKPIDCVRFLFGNQLAIKRIAACRGAVHLEVRYHEYRDEFEVWLRKYGESWVTNQTDDRVNFLLEQVHRYPVIAQKVPEFLDYLRRARGSMRPRIDRELLKQILDR